MGYYSDVAYLITGKKEDVMGFLATRRISEPDTAIAIEQITIGKYTDKMLYFGMQDNLKWNDGFEDVKSHILLYEEAKENCETNGLSGVFIRIGEDSDDVSEDCFGDDAPTHELFLTREIHNNISFHKDDDVRNELEASTCSDGNTP